MSDLPAADRNSANAPPPAGSMRWITGGTFRMGDDNAYPEEAPAHTVSGFWVDECAVTNAEFAAFVAATGYRTVAERPLDPAAYPGADPELLTPGSAVFFLPSAQVRMGDIPSYWTYVPGANWRHPEGPSTTIEGRERDPVVHVVFEDAAAYAAWAGKALPTEAEWNSPPAAGSKTLYSAWGTNLFRVTATWRTPGKALFHSTMRA